MRSFIGNAAICTGVQTIARRYLPRAGAQVVVGCLSSINLAGSISQSFDLKYCDTFFFSHLPSVVAAAAATVHLKIVLAAPGGVC